MTKLLIAQLLKLDGCMKKMFWCRNKYCVKKPKTPKMDVTLG